MIPSLSFLDKMDKIGKEGVAEELEKKDLQREHRQVTCPLFDEGDQDVKWRTPLKRTSGRIPGSEDRRRIGDNHPRVLTLSRTAKFQIMFDPTLVRGMSYYTGPIFEISIDGFGGSVGGGGRYDEMIGKFTGQKTCACGFSIGFERIVMLLLERDYQGSEQCRQESISD